MIAIYTKNLTPSNNPIIETTTAAIAAMHAIADQIIDSFAEDADCSAALEDLSAALVNFSSSVFKLSS